MTVEDLINALGLPAEARVDRRVPKALLVELGAPTAADRRQVQECVDEITWVAALKPSNIGVPAYGDELREYLEVAVLTMRLRGRARASRLIELLHRAIPYPVFLVTELPSEDGRGSLVVSLAQLRRSLGEATAVVIEGVEKSPALPMDDAREAEAAFLASLNIAGLPRGDLLALYQGWADRLTALHVATVTGAFTIAATPKAAGTQREALEAYRELSAEVTRLRNEAKRERQTRRLVDMNLELQRLERQRSEARAALDPA